MSQEKYGKSDNPPADTLLENRVEDQQSFLECMELPKFAYVFVFACSHSLAYISLAILKAG